MGKIVNLNDLSFKKNKSRVLVTGCFDVLHKAHKDFLKKAKKQALILIVGLEQDKRVNQLKGENRPINSFNIRANNLLKLKAVDYVFLLPENFKSKRKQIDLLLLIKPDVLALSENTPFLKKKKKILKDLKIKLFVFPYNPEYSTTSLLTK